MVIVVEELHTLVIYKAKMTWIWLKWFPKIRFLDRQVINIFGRLGGWVPR